MIMFVLLIACTEWKLEARMFDLNERVAARQLSNPCGCREQNCRDFN